MKRISILTTCVVGALLNANAFTHAYTLKADTLTNDSAAVDTVAIDSAEINRPRFTTMIEVPTTPIKDQSRSGTCWDYSTLSYFESEILKKTNKEYNLSEMFIANKNYMDRAVMKVRLHGDCQFSQGGSAHDVLYTIMEHGICPEEAMALPGTMYGDTLNNFSEFFLVMTPYVQALSTSTSKRLTPAWKKGLQGIIDAYLGKTPESFTYEGKTYTPKSFAESLGLDWNDYVSITSYTHHPFYTAFPLEIQDNWRQGLSWNVPMEDISRIIDYALENGYTVAWGGDVSDDGFTRDGLAILADIQKVQDNNGSDMAKWLKLTASEKKDKLQKLGVNVPELTPSQEKRQEEYDNWELTDDHGMHIYGKAVDQNGREYYKVKNSWGETGRYDGIWYMSKNYIVGKLMDFMINKNALPKDIRKKLGL